MGRGEFVFVPGVEVPHVGLTADLRFAGLLLTVKGPQRAPCKVVIRNCSQHWSPGATSPQSEACVRKESTL